MRFWDSSALVPLLVAEASTDELLALYHSDEEVLVWWGTIVECASAVARLEREGALGEEATAEAAQRLDSLAASWHRIVATDVIAEQAMRFLRVHDLRAADSLQLAAAVVAADNRPSTLEFVCRDQRLTRAAAREGFQLL